MDNIKIIPMSSMHIPKLAELEKICFSQPWSEKSLEEELDNHTAHFIVAVNQNEKIMGYMGSFVVCESCYVSNIAVFPDFRRKGVGRALIKATFRMAHKEGAESVSLEVRPSNEAAIALYTSMGFEEVGLRRNFYRDPAEDGLILTCDRIDI